MDPLTLAVLGIAIGLLELAATRPPAAPCTTKLEGREVVHDQANWRCVKEEWVDVLAMEGAEPPPAQPTKQTATCTPANEGTAVTDSNGMERQCHDGHWLGGAE